MLEIVIVCSRKTQIMPIKRHIINTIKGKNLVLFIFLNLLLGVFTNVLLKLLEWLRLEKGLLLKMSVFFKRLGSVPKINPIKIELVWIGKLLKKYVRKLLKISTPIPTPIKMGNKKLILPFISLKKFKILSNNFS